MSTIFAWSLTGDGRTYVFLLHEVAVYFLDTDGIVVSDVTRNRHGNLADARDAAVNRTAISEQLGMRLDWVRAIALDGSTSNSLAGVNDCLDTDQDIWLRIWGGQLLSDVKKHGEVLA